jgi:hypothetical protein
MSATIIQILVFISLLSFSFIYAYLYKIPIFCYGCEEITGVSKDFFRCINDTSEKSQFCNVSKTLSLEKIKEFIAVVRTEIEKLFNDTKKIIISILENIRSMVKDIVDAFLNFKDKILEMTIEIYKKVKYTIISNAMNYYNMVLKPIETFIIKNMVKPIKKLIVEIIKLKDVIRNIILESLGKITNLGQNIYKDLSNIINLQNIGLDDVFKEIDNMVDITNNILGIVVKPVADIIKKTLSIIGGLPGIPGGLPNIPGGIPNIPGGIPNIPSGLPSAGSLTKFAERFDNLSEHKIHKDKIDDDILKKYANTNIHNTREFIIKKINDNIFSANDSSFKNNDKYESIINNIFSECIESNNLVEKKAEHFFGDIGCGLKYVGNNTHEYYSVDKFSNLDERKTEHFLDKMAKGFKEAVIDPAADKVVKPAMNAAASIPVVGDAISTAAGAATTAATTAMNAATSIPGVGGFIPTIPGMGGKKKSFSDENISFEDIIASMEFEKWGSSGMPIPRSKEVSDLVLNSKPVKKVTDEIKNNFNQYIGGTYTKIINLFYEITQPLNNIIYVFVALSASIIENIKIIFKNIMNADIINDIIKIGKNTFNQTVEIINNFIIQNILKFIMTMKDTIVSMVVKIINMIKDNIMLVVNKIKELFSEIKNYIMDGVMYIYENRIYIGGVLLGRYMDSLPLDIPITQKFNITAIIVAVLVFFIMSNIVQNIYQYWYIILPLSILLMILAAR